MAAAARQSSAQAMKEVKIKEHLKAVNICLETGQIPTGYTREWLIMNKELYEGRYVDGINPWGMAPAVGATVQARIMDMKREVQEQVERQ